MPAKVPTLDSPRNDRSTSPFRRLGSFVFVMSLLMPYAPVVMSQPAKSALPEPVQVTLERKKVSLGDGKEILVSAASAKPGEVIEETATYSNRSKRTFKVDATLPVPAYTELVLGSTRPANLSVSVDGTNFARPPLKRKVTQPNGVIVEQTIPVSEYRFLRWPGVELGPEKSFTVSARFKLSDGAPATPATTRTSSP